MCGDRLQYGRRASKFLMANSIDLNSPFLFQQQSAVIARRKESVQGVDFRGFDENEASAKEKKLWDTTQVNNKIRQKKIQTLTTHR
jgi:hypothetical protein